MHCVADLFTGERVYNRIISACVVGPFTAFELITFLCSEGIEILSQAIHMPPRKPSLFFVNGMLFPLDLRVDEHVCY
jgi:hypothetical protein